MTAMTNNRYSAQVIHGEYYPHIDGIRALAVLPVLLFHVLAALCPGGFAGVDVFFVISGYLITGGILRDLARDRFTIRNFYYRRIRRIMPAYFAMIAGVFAVGCALYYSHPLVYLGDTVIMATLFASNILFWLFNNSYFDAAVHINPLLNLWSLSVEEQFYFVIPLLCAILWRVRRRLVTPALAALAVLSLAAATHAVATNGASAAFYLLHFRAWELLAGALLARLWTPSAAAPDAPPGDGAAASPCLPFWRRQVQRHALLGILGLLLILGTYVSISDHTPFPGAAALPPVAGAVLLIRYGSCGVAGRILCWRPFVVVGKLSYSLYLWHWPVIIFWRYATYSQLHVQDYAGMIATSLLLGYLSWRFVELPVRVSPVWTMRRAFAFAATGIACLLAIGTLCITCRGWPNRLHVEANRLARSEFPSHVVRIVTVATIRTGAFFGKTIDDAYAISFGAFGDYHLGAAGRPPELLLTGDSHAGHLQNGLDTLLREGNRAAYAINRTARAIFDLQTPESRYVVAELGKHPELSRVILSQRWLVYAAADTNAPGRDPAWREKLEAFARTVASMGRTLYITTDVPNYPYSPSEIAARMRIIRPRRLEPGWATLSQTDREYARMQGAINRDLEEVCRRTGAVFVPLHQAFRDGQVYITFDGSPTQLVPLYKDEQHLSRMGSVRAARSILPFLGPPGEAAGTPPRPADARRADDAARQQAVPQ